jgi:hypothetical protein
MRAYADSVSQSNFRRLGIRLPFLLQMVPAVGLGTAIHFFPYSPRWLVMRNRHEESLQSLSKLRRLPASDTRVQLEWKGIIAESRISKRDDEKNASRLQRFRPGTERVG